MKLNLDYNVKPRSPLVLANLNGLDNLITVSNNVYGVLISRLNGSDVKCCEGGLGPIPNTDYATLRVKLELNVLIAVVAAYLEGKEANCIVSTGEVIHELGVAIKRYPDLLLTYRSIGGLMRIKHLILTIRIDVKCVLCTVVNYYEIVGVSTVCIVTGKSVGYATVVSASVSHSLSSCIVTGNYKAVSDVLTISFTTNFTVRKLGTGCSAAGMKKIAIVFSTHLTLSKGSTGSSAALMTKSFALSCSTAFTSFGIDTSCIYEVVAKSLALSSATA